MPRLACELFVIPAEPDGYIVYAPLRRAAFLANSATLRLLAAFEQDDLDPSADPDGALAAFLTQLQILDGPAESWPITSYTGDPAPTTLTLLLTTACNLRCTYCYASAGAAPARFMSLDTARRGIDFVAGNAAKRHVRCFDVNYHGGGEPSLNWPVLTASLDHARERAAAAGLEMRSSVATNGVLSDAQIDWIVAHVYGASISFDGLPSAHDRHRLTRSGAGSSAAVIHTLRRFDTAGFAYGIRLTVMADQIAALPDSIEFIYANFQPKSVQVEPVYLLGRGRQAAPAETGDFVTAYRAAQEHARRQGREICFSAARLGTLTNHFCALSQDNFCVSPDGNVTACYEVCSEDHRWARLFFYGRPRNGAGGYEFDRDALERLRSQAVQNREFCASCFAKWTCAGDCYHKALELNGEVEFAGAGRCHITRELTKDQILAKIAGAGGLFWHEPV